MAEDEQAEARHRANGIPHHGEPRGRHMDVHDLHRLALLVIRGRDEEHEIEPIGNEHGRRAEHERQQLAGQVHEAGGIGQTLGQRLHGASV